MVMAHIMRPPSPPNHVRAPTTQDIAIVICGGGDPFGEARAAQELVERAGKLAAIFVGNDMIEHYPHHIDYACSLHPEKLPGWTSRRRANGFNDPVETWGHRNYQNVTHWTRDWSGSTGLFCVKIAREKGFTHVVCCGVPMTVEAGHFIRHRSWNAALGFQKGWKAHLHELRPYVRSFSGWTAEQLGLPTEEWMKEDISDRHVPGPRVGQKA